eukprot:14251330-Heterocapsa_arctica.AAC.1
MGASGPKQPVPKCSLLRRMLGGRISGAGVPALLIVWVQMAGCSPSRSGGDLPRMGPGEGSSPGGPGPTAAAGRVSSPVVRERLCAAAFSTPAVRRAASL